MMGEFAVAASGENRDERFLWIERVRAAKIIARERGAHFADQGMADEFHRHPRVGVELFFKGEDAQG